jgi:hypothetical protein
MATKFEHLAIEIAHYRNFAHLIPQLAGLCPSTVETLLSMGLFQVSTAFEHAVASVAGCAVVSCDGADLSDGSDAKIATASQTGRRYVARVSGIHNKAGALRVQVYERIQQRFYYFVIPHSAYCAIPVTSGVLIPFERDGTPRRRPGRPVAHNWWNYEVDTFQEMATGRPRLLHSQMTEACQRREKNSRKVLT